MSNYAIKIENLSKQYRLGLVGTGTLSHDLKRKWALLRGKEDPYLKIGETNDKTKKSTSEYVWALKDINFGVKQGEVLGIIGKNGAGKSTLLKILSKVTGPTTGTIKYKGRIGALLEVGTGFHQELTGRENIYLNGAILGMRKTEITKKLDEIINFSGVERYIDTPVKRYSSGMMVRLGFAVAAHLEPEILVVDEVLAVGDAEFQKKAIGKMQDVSKNDGRTVLFVSHNMGAVRNLCKSGIVLNDGKIAFIGNAHNSVDYYLSNTQNFESKSTIFNRISKKITLDVEIISIESLNENTQFATEEPLNFVFTVRGNKDVNKFRISSTINTNEDIPIGSFFGQDYFSIKKSEIKKILVSISNHNLAGGAYKLSSSLGIGDFTNGIFDYDIVIDAIMFKIYKYKQEKNNDYSIWRKNWGNLVFNGKCKII